MPDAVSAVAVPDRIEKQIVLRAPRSRVWRALTDAEEFSAWFGVRLQGGFQIGKPASGQITKPGYEHVVMTAYIEEIQPQTLFSYRWHPYAVERGVDYSSEPTTLVEFRLEEVPEGTLLKVSESGFSALPAARRAKAFEMNDGGWAGQLKNIERYVLRPARLATS
jgi:uncharacterized protein YndB with AHSA1/START domain